MIGTVSFIGGGGVAGVGVGHNIFARLPHPYQNRCFSPSAPQTTLSKGEGGGGGGLVHPFLPELDNSLSNSYVGLRRG